MQARWRASVEDRQTVPEPDRHGGSRAASRPRRARPRRCVGRTPNAAGTSTSSTATSRRSTTSTIDIAERQVTAFIGPSGCGKSTFLRCLNRMNDTIASAGVEGEIQLDGARHLRSQRWTSCSCARGRHGVPEAQPVPQVDLRERRLRAAHPRPRRRQVASWTRSSSGSLKRRGPVGRGQGPADAAGHRACRAASSSGCASPAPSPSIPR